MILIFASKFLLYIFLLLLGVWLSVIWKTRRIRHEASHLYHLKYKPLPFIGHLHHLLSDGITGVLFGGIQDALDKGIQTTCLWLGPFPVVFVCGAEDTQKILTNTASSERGNDYKYLKVFFGNGLVTAPKNIWRIKRNFANPVFHPRNVEMLIPSFNQNCQELVIDLSSHLDSGPFDVFEYSMKTALKSINQLIFGPEFTFNLISQEFGSLLRMFDRIPELINQRLWKPWLWNEYIFKYIHKKDLSEMNNTIKTLYQSSMKELNQDSGKHTQRRVHGDGSGEDTSFVNAISVLSEGYRSLQNKSESFTEKDLLDELATLYAGGTDTVALTVSSCLVALAQYPDVQEKVYNEIELVVGHDEITLEQIKEMQYLDQVFKEVQRICSVIPMIARKCSEDLKLSECTIPAGNSVTVILAGVHMNPKVYHNPKMFYPERFSPENSSDRGKPTFLPFSRGPRNCIGKGYAHLLVKMMVVHVVRRYKLFTDMNIHTMKKKWALTLVSSEGYNIRLQSRNEKC